MLTVLADPADIAPPSNVAQNKLGSTWPCPAIHIAPAVVINNKKMILGLSNWL